ncbi:rod shape-determining protein MreD [Coprobacter tertius]|uniref:Rod shape-determining protein MreD n=1 Tax=Coprobacter tertius TaxID=2944915 RepID=A0ABT1MEW8_9BACT|nr:rod shape-determining protein MreD [Coprobacter tertius]MCP9611177.1 rod shape-determining protein MreD [Coprobacter tertius]
MTKTILTYVFSFVFLVVLQVVVLKDMALLGYATPFLYIWFILRLPSLMPTNTVMTISFIMGLMIDIFCNTPGMNALAATTLAFVRKPLINVILPHTDEAVSVIPSSRSFGFGYFISYVACSVSVFCFVLFTIEAFQFFNPLKLLIRMLSSAAFTFLLIWAIDSLNPKKK